MNNHMKKEDLLYICKGRDWYNNDNVICFKGNISGKEINFDFCGYSEDEVLSGLGYFIKRIILQQCFAAYAILCDHAEQTRICRRYSVIA